MIFTINSILCSMYITMYCNFYISTAFVVLHFHLSLNHRGHWGTTDDFMTSSPHFSLFSTALWDLAKSRPIHSLMLSSHLFFHPPCLLPIFCYSVLKLLFLLLCFKIALAECYHNPSSNVHISWCLYCVLWKGYKISKTETLFLLQFSASNASNPVCQMCIVFTTLLLNRLHNMPEHTCL